MEILESISGWQEYLDDGRKYLKTALNGAKKRKNVFTPEILYNIIAMSIEKNIMGYLMYKKSLPENHTMKDLANALKTVFPLEEDLFKRLVSMDRFQEICSIEFYHIESPVEEDIKEFLNTGEMVQDFIEDQLKNVN